MEFLVIRCQIEYSCVLFPFVRRYFKYIRIKPAITKQKRNYSKTQDHSRSYTQYNTYKCFDPHTGACQFSITGFNTTDIEDLLHFLDSPKLALLKISARFKMHVALKECVA